jgi:hypothetical protein
LIIALIALPPMAAAGEDLSAPVHRPAARADAWSGARLTLWGTQVRWDADWRAFVTHENPDRTVVPVWERFETPSTDVDLPAPSYIVMREMDCGQHVWRTVGVVRFPAANLKGEARFEPSDDPWRTAGEAGGEVVSIYGSICRR